MYMVNKHNIKPKIHPETINGINKKVVIIIPFSILNKFVLESIRGCLNLNYQNYIIVLGPDKEINLPQEINKEKIKIVSTGDFTIAKKRNILINSEEADYYAFIDSDAFPKKEWLSSGINKFSEKIGAIGGPNICPPKEKVKEKAVGNSLKSFLVSGTKSFRKKISKSHYCTDLPTCNLIVKKETIKKLNGFNEKLITGEDIDLCNRIIKNKEKIYFNKETIVFHHNRTLFKPYFFQRVTYGLSIFRLFKKDPRISNLYYFTPLLMLFFIIFGLIFSFINTTIRNIWLSILIIYLIISLIEAVRYSSKISEIPHTLLALIIGNLAPGIGSLMILLNIKINVKEIYKNFQKEDKL